jgi:uncharacterized protein (DUF362 family)
LWLLLRSGTKPSRLTYPCQQAAFSTASLAFGVPVVAFLVALRRRLAADLHMTVTAVLAGIALLVTVSVAGRYSVAETGAPLREPPRDYRAQVYHVTQCPQDPVAEHFLGIDRLLVLMGNQGLKFYKSDSVTPLSGPDGIVAANDVVVIKINYQWPERGGTNTDVLRGVVRRILDHPDTFTGEVVVCENSQFNSIDGFDRATNNAQDHGQSPHDVVVGFQGQGYHVSHFDWTVLRNTSVAEYSTGNMSNGYIVEAYNSQLNGRVSYPKFQTSQGAYVSLKYGLWQPGSSTYDRERLKFINLPVLKSHHATYGATACVKHYMGVVTGNLSTNSHNAIANGILGALQGEIRPADLNILDCIWINANPNTGPQTTYGGATRRDELVASRDPVAADIWAVKNILIPAFVANGYSPPWPAPSADPDLPNSAFRNYLDHSMSYLLAAGFNATNNLSLIDTYTWNGVGDANCDGAVNFDDISPFVLALGDPAGYASEFPYCIWQNSDCNGDGQVTFDDIDPFVALLSSTGRGI